MNFFIFLGPPGSGKGTQAQSLAACYPEIKHVSTGQLLRDAVSSKTKLGLSIASVLETGALISDELIIDVMTECLSEFDSTDTVILDGFPRTIHQANLFAEYVKKTGSCLKKVVYFEIEDNLLIDRLTGRFSCVECSAVYHKINKKPLTENVCDFCGSTHFEQRKDDSSEVVSQRICAYHAQTKPLFSYYEDTGLLSKVDASLPLETIKDAVVKLVTEVDHNS